MIYLVYLSDLLDLDHDLSIRYTWFTSWFIWSICSTYLIWIMIGLISLSDLSGLDHDLSDLSVRYIWSRSWSVRSIWPPPIRKLSTWYIGPIYLMWSICSFCLMHTMIYLIYLSNLLDLDHGLCDLFVRSMWSRSWSILSICPIYLILNMIYPSNLCDLDHYLSDLSFRSIWSRSWSIWCFCPNYLI